MEALSKNTVMFIVLGILTMFFFTQQFGTSKIGNLFGPFMGDWFLMLAALGIMHITDDLSIIEALNPAYGIQFLFNYHEGFWLSCV